MAVRRRGRRPLLDHDTARVSEEIAGPAAARP